MKSKIRSTCVGSVPSCATSRFLAVEVSSVTQKWGSVTLDRGKGWELEAVNVVF